MDLTRSLLSLPMYLLLVVLIVFSGGISAVVTWLFRKYMRPQIKQSQNDITGYIFTVVAGFYALILAFVVFQALQEINDVQRDADIEGSLAKSLYRQIKYYPDAAAIAPVKKEYLKYVNLVITQEYPNMAVMTNSDSTTNSFGRVFELLEQLKPGDENTLARAEIIYEQRNELAKYRSLRIFAGDSEIPVIMWIVLIIGGLITLILAAILNVENQFYHLFINALMGAFVGLVFFLIIILDHPFTGSLRVEPTGYNVIIKMDKNPGMK